MSSLGPASLARRAQPRVRSVPPYVSSSGDEAVELATAFGLVPLPWQRDAIRDILGERPDGRWSAPEVGLIVPRQNGKNAGVTDVIELAGLILFGEKLILHSAHEFKTAMEAFRRFEALFTNWDSLRKRVKSITSGNGKEGIELLSGQRLRIVARSKGSSRGFTSERIILDEAYELTAAQIEAMLPTTSAVHNPQIIYTSSPPLDGVTGEQLMSVRERGESGVDPELCWIDYGLAGELEDLSGIDLDDRALWYATNPSMPDLLSEEAIARNRRIMSPSGFARECLGVWPRRVEGGGVFDAALWASLADGQAQVGDDLTIAVDVSPMGTHSAIGIASPVGDRMHVELIDHRPGTHWVVRRMVQLKERYDPVAVVLDAKGPAGELLTDLDKAGISLPADPDHPKRGDLIIPTAGQVAAGCAQMLTAVRQKAIVHIDQQELNIAVAGAKTRPLGDAVAWGRKLADVDISPLVAVTLARWAYYEREHVLSTGPEMWVMYG